MKTPAIKTAFAGLGVLLCAATSIQAAGYTKAEITRTFNEVKVLKENTAAKAGTPGTQITPVTSVATGADSRAELQFPDKSLTRLGSNSRFTLRGDARNLDLDDGVMLLQVPKGVGGAKVRTAAVTAAVTGTTVLLEYKPEGQGDSDGYMKVICVEGSLDLIKNDDPSTFVTVKAGQLSLTRLGSDVLGQPVDIDLKTLLKTSKLINADENTPNQQEVSQAVQTQQKELTAGTLVQTNLVIPGRGNVVIVDTIGNILNNLGFIVQQGNQPPAPGTTGPPGTAQNNPNPNNDTPFQGFLPLIAGKTVLGDDSSIQTNPHVTAYNLLQGTMVTSEGRLYYALIPFSAFSSGIATTETQSSYQTFLLDKVTESGAGWAAFKFEDLFIHGTPSWQIGSDTPTDASDSVNVILASVKGIRLGPDSAFPDELPPTDTGSAPPALTPTEGPNNTLDLYYSGLDSLSLYSQSGDIIIRGPAGGNAIYGYNQNVAIVAASVGSDVRIEGDILLETGSGGSALLGVSAGRDVLVTNASMQAGDVKIEAGRDVTGSGAKITANNTINVKARRHITFSSSSQLKTLLNSTSAKILLESTQGDINLDNGTILDSPGGTIELLARQGNINLMGVTSSSDVFKAQTLGTNGWITVGGNTSISATTAINLFAEGAGNAGVRFNGNATLDSQSVNIKGRTVEILGGSTEVQITQGNLSVTTDNARFNGGGFGYFKHGSNTLNVTPQRFSPVP